LERVVKAVIKKRILIHSIAFSPDGVSTAYLYNDLAIRFKNAGFDVVVLSTTPHYNYVLDENTSKQVLKKVFWKFIYKSNFNGISVYHIWQKKFKSTFLRLLGFVYWHFSALLTGLLIKKPDFIISPSPPLTIGLVSLIIGRIRRSKVIYNVQEIYPDFLINQGVLKNQLIIYLLNKIESVVYNKSDKVITIDSVFYQTIKPRFIDSNKLMVIPNFVDCDLYKPMQDASSTELNKTLFPNTPFLKVMYAGNIGFAQDWKTFIEVAKSTIKLPILYFIIGEGVCKSYLQKIVLEQELLNIKIIPYQKRETMPFLINYADLHFIFMDRNMDKEGFPSKVYTIMACEKPLLVSSGIGSPIIEFLTKNETSFLFTNPDYNRNINEIVNKLTYISANKEELKLKGASARELILSEYSTKSVTEKYIEMINSLHP
jgi:colanic acid biosynthesis glycosyl transferase WcaI